jgi:hypothetical protein
MDSEVVKWLLSGPEWLRYAVNKQLLDRKPDPQAVGDLQIQRLLTILVSDGGLDSIMDGTASYKNEVFWYLYFLADIGFTATELSLESDLQRILELEDEEHKFLLSQEMKPDYFCISSILLYSLAQMSGVCKTKLLPHVETILAAQRLDGGWHCAKSRAIGGRLEGSDSCPMDNLNILMLLSSYESYREDSRLDGAIDLLLKHWEYRVDKWRPYGFGVGTQYLKLRYPEEKYGILRVLDVLSCYPRALRSEAFSSMFEMVKQKSPEGCYFAESVRRSFSDFDFGQKKEPSRWITFLVARIEKRMGAGK